jgi:cell division septum initiation protein DivIVA
MSIELTPELAPEFAVTVRGYDRAQVDEYIDWLREWLSNATVRMESAEAEAAQLRDQLRRLQLRVDDLEAETSDHPPRTIGALGERMTRILELAEEGAAAVRADAESDAERLLNEARAEADRLARGSQARQAELDSRLSNANERAQQIIAEAEATAAESVARQMLEVETRANGLEADAQQRARELVERAEQERARILEQLTTEKAALDAHIEGLVAQRAEVLAGLSKLHESLSTAIVDAPAGTVSTADRLAEPDRSSDATAANELGDAVDLRDSGPGGHGDSASGRGAGDRGYADAPAGRPTGTSGGGPGEEPSRVVLFDREAVEEQEAPPAPVPPSFRRAGSQPEGSQRAGQ